MTNRLVTSELAAVREELRRVDDKCQTLAKVAGTGQAALVLLVSTARGSIPAEVLLAATGVTLALAALVVLSALRPQLGTTGFRRYARLSVDQVGALFAAPARPYAFDPDGPAGGAAAGVRADQVEAEHLKVLSQIVDRKYCRLRVGFTLTSVAIVFLASALVAGVIA